MTTQGSGPPKKRGKRIKKRSPKQKEYSKLRKKGIAPKDAYPMAGYKGQPNAVNISKVESRHTDFLITRVDALRLGRRAAKKIFKDFIDNKPQANPASVVKIITMQQDRIDPAVHKVEANTKHTSISIEIQAAVSSDYQAMLDDVQVIDILPLPTNSEPKALGTDKAQVEEAELVKP